MKSRLNPTLAPGDGKPRFARASKKIKADVEEQFGFFPPFFTPALETPEILENLWRQTLSAYVNNPLPALFKERLFAYLSRYCAVPYCIICHSCALRPLGMTAAEVLALLTEPAPATEIEIGKHLDLLAAQSSPLKEWPAPGSALDESLMACSIFSFLNPAQAEDCRAQKRRLLGEEKYAYLMVFLGYVKTCHLWVEAHPELSYEADQRARDYLGPLLAEEPRLAEFFRDYGELIARERQGRDESVAMNRLHELGTRLVKVSDLQELLEEILDATIALQNADFGNIQLYDRETGALKIVAQRGFKQDFLDYFNSVHEGQAACGLALQQRHRVIIEDVDDDPGFTPHRQIAASAGFRAVQSTPLFSRDGDPIGVLSTHFRRPRRPSEYELRLTDLYFRLASELIGGKKIEQALRQQARLLDMSHDAIFVWKLGGAIRYWNHAAEDLYGWACEEAQGRVSHELLRTVHPGPWPLIEAALLRDGHWNGELIHQTRDGRQIVVDSWQVLVREEDGQSLVLETNRDLTARKEAEKALRESEARMAGVINLAMDAIISVDDQQRVILFNAAAEKMFGYSAAEVMGYPISILIPDRFRASHQHYIQRFGVTGETDRAMGGMGAISGLRSNGEEFPIEASISQIDIGARKLFTVILRDITRRVQDEAALRESREQLVSILDTTIDGIVTVDDDQRIVLFNAAAEKIFRSGHRHWSRRVHHRREQTWAGNEIQNPPASPRSGEPERDGRRTY